MASNYKRNLIAKFLFPPVFVFAGILALWENEGRFNYYQAAIETIEIFEPGQALDDTTISMTGNLDTEIPISGFYVEQIDGYYKVMRSAEIYSWDKTNDSDGDTTWSKGWHSSLESNSRNTNLRQTLSSDSLYPDRYQLGELQIVPKNIHFVDDSVSISPDILGLTSAGRNNRLIRQGDYFYKRKGDGSALGDERISYQGIPYNSTATYFGLVEGSSAIGKQFEISQSMISSIIQNDGILHHLVNGTRMDALNKMQGHFKRLKWIVRGGGTFAVVLGIYLFFSFFVNLLYRIPFVGGLISAGVLVISLILGLAISLLVMFTSILLHFPFLVGLPILLIVGAIYWFSKQASKTRVNVQKTLESKQSIQSLDGDSTDSGADPIAHNFENMVRLALVDGELDKKENNILIHWGAKNGLTKKRMTEIFARATEKKSLARETSREDFTTLICLAMADGVLSTEEESYLISIAKGIGMLASDVRKIIMDIESGNLQPARD